MTDLAFEARAAELSPDGVYRYKLSRIWAPDIPPALFIMLNPSTADANQDDPTIRRCIAFAKRLGHGGLLVGNLFALRSTNPARLFAVEDPVGPGNDQALQEMHAAAAATVVAWGAEGDFRGRDEEVRRALPGEVYCLGVTLAGAPRHPLYLPKTSQLRPWPDRPPLTS